MIFSAKKIKAVESLDFFNELIEKCGYKNIPSRVMFDGNCGKEFTVYENEIAKFIVGDGELLSNIIIKKDITEEETFLLMEYIDLYCPKGYFVNSEFLSKMKIDTTQMKYHDSNFFYDVDSNYLKYSSNKWRRKRNVIDKYVEFRKISVDELDSVRFIYELWKKNKNEDGKSFYDKDYKKILNDNELYGMKFEPYGLFYHGVLIAFKYITYNTDYIASDFMHNSSSVFKDDIFREFINSTIYKSNFIRNYSEEVREKVKEYTKYIHETANVKDERRILYISEIQRLKKEWRLDAIKSLEKFIKVNSVNTFKYLFIKTLKDLGIKYCFEDFCGTGKLSEFKNNRIDGRVDYFLYSKKHR